MNKNVLLGLDYNVSHKKSNYVNVLCILRMLEPEAKLRGGTGGSLQRG